MTKIYSTLGRKFNKKDLEEAQRMGQELVRITPSFLFYDNCLLYCALGELGICTFNSYIVHSINKSIKIYIVALQDLCSEAFSTQCQTEILRGHYIYIYIYIYIHIYIYIYI